jgi:mannose-1-phosphate guanylyltransferase
MKIIIFAGGTGRRLWPISRKNSPKQFEPIIGHKSTVQLAVARLLERFSVEDILISTNEAYLGILHEQLPEIPQVNFIGEPVRRDLAAAVGLGMVHAMNRFGPDEPVAIIWGDNYMTDQSAFLGLLNSAEKILDAGRAKMIFIGETPRFANNNLGWIGLGPELGIEAGTPFYTQESWFYRPPLDLCRKMFDSGDYVWNTGYFVSRAGYIIDAYIRFQPVIWKHLSAIRDAIKVDEYSTVLHQEYLQIEVASFDDAIVKHIDSKDAVVLHGNTGWSDPGTLYALKEAVNPRQESNVEKGLVKSLDTRDSLLYNYEPGKLLTAVGLDGMVVVNTEDAILVVHKDDISLVKELVDDLSTSELEKYS